MLYWKVVLIFSIAFLLFILYYFRGQLYYVWSNLKESFPLIQQNKIISVSLLLIIVLAIVNLIGALGPELAFDALWYHLTLPKIYLTTHTIAHIPGGLLYYSDMPKLGELLYVSALSFGSEIYAKVIHWFFGILCLIVMYKIARRFFSQELSLIAVLIFYSNLVVSWESITAYIDLIRAFFELLALWSFLFWWEVKRKKWFVLSAIMIGLAVSTKVLAIGSIMIFSVLLLYKFVIKENSWIQGIKYLLSYWTIALLIPMPWFVFAYVNTGNPLYPIFSEILSGVNAKIFDISLLNPLHILTTFWNVFTWASDPLSPIYIIFLPLIIWLYKYTPKHLRILYAYSILAAGVWYSTSQVEGSRLLIPYLPVFSILCASVLSFYFTRREKYKFALLIALVMFVSLTTIGYRFLANVKYLPVILGQQTKAEFLQNNLDFSFGDFYDVDGYFSREIKSDDKVLLMGFHNLYYVDFPYIHDSWLQKEDEYNYIAVQDGELPQNYTSWKLIYENKTTNVKLYSDSSFTNDKIE